MTTRSSKQNSRTSLPHERLDLDKDQYNKLSTNERIIVSLLSSKIDDIYKKFEAELLKRDSKIKELENEVKISKLNYVKLENKLDDLDASSKGNSLVISGTEIPIMRSNENCVTIARDLIRNQLKHSIDDAMICSAHRIGKPPSTQKPDRRNILVKMNNEEVTQDIVRASKTVKPTNIYFSENLIPKRHGILTVLRRIKRSHSDKMSGCSSIRGRVYVWIPPPRPDAPGARSTRVSVNTRSELEDFCMKSIGVSLDAFLQTNDRFV